MEAGLIQEWRHTYAVRSTVRKEPEDPLDNAAVSYK
jgi:hypothetical protein